ncbi:MAG: hypothetical protein MUE48_11595 [Desulfobacterales bacterium]|nr:hypothetical protein [Desulfobacterales bacterium]
MDLDLLTLQVRSNCDVSDAHHAGMFSVCGLALRLRDLFKWERGLRPWEEGNPAEVLEWIGAREERWEALAQADFGPLTVGGRQVDPFEAEAVNAALGSAGLWYGAGYARGLKPVFFLAEVEESTEMDDCRVVAVGRELARDLLTPPALSQGPLILLRRDAAARALWDQLAFVAPSARRAVDAALAACGIGDRSPAALRLNFGRLLRVQEELHLHHELGEIRETALGHELFREIVAAFPLTRVELVVRRLKDVLADTHPAGPLRRFCRTRSTAGVALFLAGCDRATQAMFPELADAANAVLGGAGWAAAERVLSHVRSAALAHAAAITEACAGGVAAARLEALVEDRFGAALGRLPQESE